VDSTGMVVRADRPDPLSLTIPWWFYLISAAFWFIVAWVVLRFDLATVTAISILAGIVIILAGCAEVLNAFAASSWKWLHGLLGVVFIITGCVALLRPGGTFAWLAAFVGWYLMFKGLLDVFLAFATKDVNDAWWLGLIIGIIEIGLGFWAAGRFGRSAALLVLFVAAIALTRGITDIVLAFRMRRPAA
jgi:uncharacterized membrane protein HdeD (DUF308 family)